MSPWVILSTLLLSAANLPALNSEVKFNGFVKTWASLGEDSDQSLRRAALGLKSARLKVSADSGEGVKAVIVPELAGGVSLLDAYATYDLHPSLTLGAGQFKFGFGQDRMETPATLDRVDYSPITTPILNRTGVNGWDQGLFAVVKAAGLKADFAAFQGKGPNVANTLREVQEFSARAEYTVVEGIVAGASFYSGLNGAAVTVTAQDDYVSGAHLRAAFGAGELRVEWINQHFGKYGLLVQPALKLGDAKLFLAYDRINHPQGDALGATALGGGACYDLTPAFRLTLQAGGAGSGADQTVRNFSSTFQVLGKF